MLFQLQESKPVKKIKVAGVVIPLYGYLTVNESIAIDKALIELGDSQITTQIQIHRLAAWLSVRLSIAVQSLVKDLSNDNAKPLIDTLWEYYVQEAFPKVAQTVDVEEIVEGKEEEPITEVSSN